MPRPAAPSSSFVPRGTLEGIDHAAVQGFFTKEEAKRLKEVWSAHEV